MSIMYVHRGVPRQRDRGLGMLGGLAIKMLPKLLMGPRLGLAGSILPGLLNHGQRGSCFKDVARKGGGGGECYKWRYMPVSTSSESGEASKTL